MNSGQNKFTWIDKGKSQKSYILDKQDILCPNIRIPLNSLVDSFALPLSVIISSLIN